MAATLKLGNANWAAKEGSLLAYNDENNNFKPLPFDFTRASSATYVASDGLIKTSTTGQPRIDFLGNTNGALLLEPQRTNLITYSEDFSQSNWIKNNAGTGSPPVVTSNFTIAPDGTSTASKIVFDAEFKENERKMKEDWKIQAAEMLESAGCKDVKIFDSNAPIGCLLYTSPSPRD